MTSTASRVGFNLPIKCVNAVQTEQPGWALLPLCSIFTSPFSGFVWQLAGLTLSTAAPGLCCASLLFSLCRFSFAFFTLWGDARKLLILNIFRTGVAGTAAAVEWLALAGPKLHFAGLPQLCFPLCFSPAHTSPFSFLCFRPFSSTRTFFGGGGKMSLEDCGRLSGGRLAIRGLGEFVLLFAAKCMESTDSAILEVSIFYGQT